MTIPIITRTNTIDEWRIQTNLSAEKLNDLETGDFNKTDGTLTLSGDSTLILTSEGTPLQVSNNALIQKDLTIGSNLSVGTIGTRIGNVSVGNTVIVAGQGVSLYVSNTAQLGNLSVIGTAYSNNATVNNNAVVGNDVLVGGVVSLSGSGKVIDANNGIVYIKDAYLSNATLQRANVDSIYALEATIDNLKDIASAVIGILRVSTGNIYVLSSDTLYANTGTIKDFVANSTGNVVTLTSNLATINTAIIGNLSATNGTIVNGNVVTLISNNATLNTSTLINTTVTNAAISNAVISSATITTGQITTGTITNGTIINGNVVTLTSNLATINNSTLLSSNVVSVNIVNANVSGNLNFTNGSSLRLSTGSANDAIVVETGLTSLQSVVVEGNLTVAGIFTQTGNINFETDRFIFNANTTENKDALIITERVSGNDAQIIWNETQDRWEISTGNVWTQTYKILDGADIYTGVDSDSTTSVASASAVKFAYQAGGVIAGGYANSAFAIANAAYNGVQGTHANSAFAIANLANQSAVTSGSYANSAFSVANTADQRAVTSGSYANSAFAVANTALIAGGQIAGSYANSAFIKANQSYFLANVAFDGEAGAPPAGWGPGEPGDSLTEILLPDGRSHRGSHAWHAYRRANSAQALAQTARDEAAVADQKAVTSGSYANSAFAIANLSNQRAVTSGSYANSAFSAANNKLDLTTGGTVAGPVVFNGTITHPGFTAGPDEFSIKDARVTLNSDLQSNQGPNSVAGFDINRGNSPTVSIIWDETALYGATARKWRFTNDGTNWQEFIGSSDLSGYLLRSGGTMTGTLTIAAGQNLVLGQDPTVDLQAATKRYVDTRLAGTSSLPSQTSNSGRFLRTDGTNAYWYQFSNSDTFSMNINGRASVSSTADGPTAGTTQPWPRATYAANLDNGATVQAGTFSCSSSFYCAPGATFQQGATFGGDISAPGRTITAGFFNGTSASSRYADLAEKYLADQLYGVGTLVSLGGEKEVTASTIADFKVLGVVSSNPAYLMNSELEGGTAIALKGRVPVRVLGKVKKGQPLGVSNIAGVAEVNFEKYFGLAIENKDTDEEGLVETAIL